MVKMIWLHKSIEIESENGLTVRKAVIDNKEHFQNITTNDCPIRVLKRNPVTSLPSSCIQIGWDDYLFEGDEIEFFAPGGRFDLERS